MTAVVLDLVLLALLVGYAVAGWRTGFVITVTSLLGFVGGGVAGLALMPRIMAAADLPTLTRGILLVGGTLVMAIGGQALMGVVGVRLGGLVRGHRVGRGADGAAGAVVAALVTLGMVWAVGTAVRPLLPPSWSRTIAGSHLLGGVDDLMPEAAANVLAEVRTRGESEVFPRVFGGLSEEPITPVAPPDAKVPTTSGLTAAKASVVRVVAEARQCSRLEKGSGWVVAPGRVVTNAHVVAGSNAVTVSSAGTGRLRDATVVAFDPRLDLAVLVVPGLPVPPLQTAADLPRNAAAVVAGFPLGGSYTVGSARIREVLTATGADIYDAGKVDRSVYSLFATVRPGNSGGPLLDTQGRVVGTVFARSLDDPRTGYALTMAQSRSVIGAGLTGTVPVATGACTKE